MSEIKKRKFNDKKKPNYYKKSRKNYMEIGQRGFLVTCNFREKDCVRECYNLLNQYYNSNENKQSESEEEVDISTQLANDLEKAKAEGKRRTFQQVTTDTTNCIFIKASIPDPMELGVKILNDIYETKKQQSRFILRFIPVQAICKASLKDIIEAAGLLADKYLLKEPKTFSIIFNKRYNNDINRDDIIREVAELVSSKNIKNKVNLKTPEVSIIIEVIKGLCCISVAPDYMKLRKYNLVELCGKGQHNPYQPNEKEVDETDEKEKLAKPDEPMDKENEKVINEIDENDKSACLDDPMDKVNEKVINETDENGTSACPDDPMDKENDEGIISDPI